VGLTIAEYQKLKAKQNRGKVAPTEHDLQVACVQWFRYCYPRQARLLFSIPNGARRTRWERSVAVSEGLVSGVPDLFLAVARHGKHGLWIEMKNGKAGRLSVHQREMIAALEAEGYACVVCHSMLEFQKAVQDYQEHIL